MTSLVVRGFRLPKTKTSFALPSLLGTNLPKLRYSTENNNNEEDTVSEVAHKARSTAEEFLRQAKEKKDEVRQSAKEAWEGTKEAVAGEEKKQEEEFKEKVEKGDYDHVGRRG